MSRPDKHKNIMQLIAVSVQAGRLMYSSHASQRMHERKIVKPEVEYILTHGHHEPKKDQFKTEFGSWDYAIKGKTFDKRELRIVVAIESPGVLVVTAIDLNRKDEL